MDHLDHSFGFDYRCVLRISVFADFRRSDNPFSEHLSSLLLAASYSKHFKNTVYRCDDIHDCHTVLSVDTEYPSNLLECFAGHGVYLGLLGIRFIRILVLYEPLFQIFTDLRFHRRIYHAALMDLYVLLDSLARSRYQCFAL